MVGNQLFFYRFKTTDCTSGGTNYRGQIVFAGEGQGDNEPPALWVMNPKSPFNATG